MPSCTSFTPTCDLDPATDGTAQCPSGCTSASESCTGGPSTDPSQCTSSGSTTDPTYTDEAACLASGTCTGIGSWADQVSCEPLYSEPEIPASNADGNMECSTQTLIDATCTGISTDGSCDDGISTDETDCRAGPGADSTGDNDGIWTPATCDLDVETDGTALCPTNCSSTQATCQPPSAVWTPTNTWTSLTCDLDSATDGTDACHTGCTYSPDTCSGTAHEGRICDNTKPSLPSSPSSSTPSRSSYDGSFDLSLKQIAGILLIFFLFISLMGFINYK